MSLLPQISYPQVRASLLAGEEIALLDSREEDPHAQAHPLFAANLPLARIELDAYTRLPRRDVPIVVIDDQPQQAELAARRLQQLGYTDVALLDGGIAGWQTAGGELFRDVNVPSKAFGELVEAQAHTPSLSAEEVQALLDSGADVLIVDARRFDEYQTMSIPGSTSVPGAELALRVPSLTKRPTTQVIVNCAGHTRSIIGTQSLRNAGLANPVAALRNGTIGWILAGQTLAHQQTRRFPAITEPERRAAAATAHAVADRAGVGRCHLGDVATWQEQRQRTTYCFDVRTPEEYRAGHLPGFRDYPGGQLVQETDMAAPVRGARIVVADDDGVRANMTASWLAQMGWQVLVVDGLVADNFCEQGPFPAPLSALPAVAGLSVTAAKDWLNAGDVLVLDFSTSPAYRRAHLPGAWFVLRSALAAALDRLPPTRRYLLTCSDGRLASLAAAELAALIDADIRVLDGGNAAWLAAGLPGESGEGRLASPPIDRYRRPYEGTDAPREAMQGYLDWEFGLVAQLARDGSHGFWVLGGQEDRDTPGRI